MRWALLVALTLVLAACSALPTSVTGEGETVVQAGSAMQGESGCGEVVTLTVPDASESDFPRGDGPRVLAMPETSLSAARKAGYHALIPSRTFERELVFAGQSSEGLYLYFGTRAVQEQETLGTFLAAGGFQLIEYPGQSLGRTTVEVTSSGEATTNTTEGLPEGIRVSIGDATGVISRSQAYPAGATPFSLVWSSRGSVWLMNSGMADPERLVAVARSLECA